MSCAVALNHTDLDIEESLVHRGGDGEHQSSHTIAPATAANEVVEKNTGGWQERVEHTNPAAAGPVLSFESGVTVDALDTVRERRVSVVVEDGTEVAQLAVDDDALVNRLLGHTARRTPEQARMKLIRTPIKPKRSPLISIRLGHDKYESWKAFLSEAYWSVELK